MPTWILSGCKHMSGDAPLILHSVRSTRGKRTSAQWGSSLELKTLRTKQIGRYPRGQSASEASDPRTLISLFFFTLTLVHKPPSLTKVCMWQADKLCSASVSVLGVSLFVLSRNQRQRIGLAGWSLSKFILLCPQILHCFPKFKDKLEENITRLKAGLIISNNVWFRVKAVTMDEHTKLSVQEKTPLALFFIQLSLRW